MIEPFDHEERPKEEFCETLLACAIGMMVILMPSITLCRNSEAGGTLRRATPSRFGVVVWPIEIRHNPFARSL